MPFLRVFAHAASKTSVRLSFYSSLSYMSALVPSLAGVFFFSGIIHTERDSPRFFENEKQAEAFSFTAGSGTEDIHRASPSLRLVEKSSPGFILPPE